MDGTIWPLQDIRLYIPGLCTSQFLLLARNTSFISPPQYFSHTQYRAIYGSTTTPIVCVRHHTTSAIAISCKGQGTMCFFALRIQPAGANGGSSNRVIRFVFPE